jgi:tetratricopeptide (TPR) repeat protein
MLIPFFKPTRILSALFGVILLMVTAAPAQQPAAPVRDYSPTDETSEALTKYRAALEAKPPNFDGAIAILDAQITRAVAGSYDLALLYQFKAQTLLQKGDFTNSIDPIERGLSLSDSKTPTYFDDRVTHDIVYFLAQLYVQEAMQSKNPTVVIADYDKAEKYMVRWARTTKKPTVENQLFYAQLLYSRAVQNADHPDLDMIKRALEEVEKGLLLSSRPKEQLYMFKFACLQQLNRNAEAAEILELLITLKPDSDTFWQQLAALYVSTEQNTRAILAFERAQTKGHLNKPKDNYNLIGLYFNIGQFEKSAELLEIALKTGGIEKDIKNWELLALSYQQLERPLKAIEALKDAAKAFPQSGDIELRIAQAYHTLEKPDDALPHAQAAIAKGDLAKPSQAYIFLAYIAYELKKYDVALTAAKKAAEYPEGAKDGKNMVRAIDDILKEREAKKNKM